MKLQHWAYFYKARILEMFKQDAAAIGGVPPRPASRPQRSA